MALTGHLSDLSLSELIEFFCNQRKTGQLKVLYPEGHGCFYLQAGSVIDARIGVLRGIDAVYYALTLPNAKFEFGPASEALERTINQPWTQVVLEGLRRLDEGVIPAPAFPPDYKAAEMQQQAEVSAEASDLENLRVPGFLSFISKESVSRRKYIAGAVAVVVVMAVAAIGVPAGWYGPKVNPVANQPAPAEAPAAPAPVAEVATVPQSEQPAPVDVDAAAEARRQRERDRLKAREEREDKVSNTVPAVTNPAGSPVSVVEPPKAGPKKVVVTVTYDESGRVTQASGGDATAVRIARQKRFPAGKAGSATVTIPIN
ncbi:MAG TPA: DUF4388 domain-containing protein [Pyrinomonadaceae bacterium]|nr:DUF4388 domain-containing protein [Pyrinomonadaceae bacterium]